MRTWPPYGSSGIPATAINMHFGLTGSEVKKKVEEEVSPWRNEALALRQKTAMYRIHKKALVETINRLVCQRRATTQEVYQSYRSYCRQFAENEGFKLRAAEKHWEPNEAKTIVCRLYNCRKKDAFQGLTSQKMDLQFPFGALLATIVILVVGGVALVIAAGKPETVESLYEAVPFLETLSEFFKNPPPPEGSI